MTIRNQIPSEQADKTNKQTRKQRQPTENRQKDETNLKRPNASDEDHREGWPSNDDQSGIAGGWQEELLHAHRPGIIKAPDN